MDLESDAMTERVLEELAVSSGGDAVAGDAVEFAALDSLTHMIAGELLGIQNGAVDSSRFRAEASDADGSGHVAVVSSHDASEIERQQIPASELSCRGPAMGECAALTARDNRFEGIPVCSQTALAVGDLGGDLTFQDTGFDEGEDPVKDLVAYRDSPFDQIDLPSVFPCAKLFNGFRPGNESYRRKRLFEQSVLCEGNVVPIEADAQSAAEETGGGESFEQTLVADRNGPGDNLVFRLLTVSSVRDEAGMP
jgi:hypothetical protein